MIITTAFLKSLCIFIEMTLKFAAFKPNKTDKKCYNAGTTKSKNEGGAFKWLIQSTHSTN